MSDCNFDFQLQAESSYGNVVEDCQEYLNENVYPRNRRNLRCQNQYSFSFNSRITDCQEKENLHEGHLHQQTESTNLGEFQDNNTSQENNQSQEYQQQHHYLSDDSQIIQEESKTQESQNYHQNQNLNSYYQQSSNQLGFSYNNLQDQINYPPSIQNLTNIDELNPCFINQLPQSINNQSQFESTQMFSSKIFHQCRENNNIQEDHLHQKTERIDCLPPENNQFAWPYNNYQGQINQPTFFQNQTGQNISSIDEFNSSYTNQHPLCFTNQNQLQLTQIRSSQFLSELKEDKRILNKKLLNSKQSQNEQSLQSKTSSAKQKAIKKRKVVENDKYVCKFCILKYKNHSGLTNHAKKKHQGLKTSDIQLNPNTTLGRPPKPNN
ncbi:hypothetical protein ABPG74_018271 [Tetrahymena malaccensis]